MNDVQYPDIIVDLPADASAGLIRSRVQKALTQSGMPDVAGDYIAATDDVRHDMMSVLEASRAWVTVNYEGTVSGSESSPSGRTVALGTATVAGDVDSQATYRAVRAARFVEVCSYVFGGLGILFGFIIALTEDKTWRDFTGAPAFSEKYPDFWVGLSVSLAVAFQAAIVVMISAYIQARLARRSD